MAATNYTPIQLYYSTTAAAVPVNTNFASGELAINIADGLLFYKDNLGAVQKIGYKLTPTTAGGTGLTSFTANGIVYASSTSALATGSALVFDGTNFSTTGTVGSTGNAAFGGGSVPVASGFQYGIGVGPNGLIGTRSAGNDYRLLIGTNQKLDGTYRSTTSQPVSVMTMDNGVTSFSIGPAGTAGNAISFTQAMTLDASGNLGIGTTLPTSRLHVSHPSASTNAIAQFTNGTTGTGAGNGLYVGIDSTNTATIFNFYNSNLQFGTNATTKMVLDTSGNLLVGVSSFPTGSTVGAAINGAAGFASFSRAGDSCLLLNTNTDSPICRIYRSGSQVGSIDVTTIATIYNTTSDYRLKTVVGAVTGQGERIDALEPIEYTWNSNGLRTRGFLAHKFKEVYAQSVTGTKDGVDADGKPEYQSMQASTSEVIADLVAEIQSLRKRLAAAGI